MCEKLEAFVRDSPEKKNIIRRYAGMPRFTQISPRAYEADSIRRSIEENNIELVLCIVRGADEPRLPAFLLTRIRKAQVTYRKFAKTNPSPLMKAQVQDPDIRLVLELQTYLRLASRDRDAALMRAMLANEDFAAAIEVVAAPFIALLKRTYRVGNAAQLLSEMQTFMNQLIISTFDSHLHCLNRGIDSASPLRSRRSFTISYSRPSKEYSSARSAHRPT